MSDICLGIDLGTTYSCVAYVDDETGKAVTLKNNEGQLTTPSAVYFEEKDNIVIGDEAKTYAVTEPEKTVTFIKREMGSDFKREIFDTEYTPQEVSAIILKKIVQDANSALADLGVIKDGEYVKKAVITCPAYFGMTQKEATKMAGEMAGLEVLDIINEPTAAAINYGMLHKDSGTYLVYDLGGGTFDVTIIKIEKNNIEVVCTGGEPTLGGKDWDMASVRYFVEQWQEQMNTDEDISEDLETYCELMAAAEKAKKSLSAKEKTPVNINYDGQKLKLEYTREKFEEITAHLLEQTVSLTKDCIKAAEAKGVPANSIGNILLVGGSSKMPQVEAILKKEFPSANVFLCDPDEGVAKGAALYAKCKGVEVKVLEDVIRKTGKTESELKKQNESKYVKIADALYIICMVLYGVLLLKISIPVNPEKRILIGIVIPGMISLVYMSCLCIKEKKKMFVADQWKFVAAASIVMMFLSNTVNLFMTEKSVNLPILYAAVGGLVVTAVVVLLGNVINIAVLTWRNHKERTQG